MIVLECREPGLAETVIAERAATGHPYDYELGERYVMAPAPSIGHGQQAVRISSALLQAGANAAAPANLGRIDGPSGTRWYVVPDVVVLEDEVPDATASLRALVAIEVRSPRGDRDRKLAEYREVMKRTGLVVEEVWYLSDGSWSVHPAAQPARRWAGIDRATRPARRSASCGAHPARPPDHPDEYPATSGRLIQSPALALG